MSRQKNEVNSQLRFFNEPSSLIPEIEFLEFDREQAGRAVSVVMKQMVGLIGNATFWSHDREREVNIELHKNPVGLLGTGDYVLFWAESLTGTTPLVGL